MALIFNIGWMNKYNGIAGDSIEGPAPERLITEQLTTTTNQTGNQA